MTGKELIIGEDRQIINRFMGMMSNWISEASTSYFVVRYSRYEFIGEYQDVVVPSSREGYYARGFGWKIG
jgi:hypothetical protein